MFSAIIFSILKIEIAPFSKYNMFQFGFMVWLMIPTEFNGSILLYRKIIKPYFLKHHQVIDDTLNKVKDSGKLLICI